MLFLSSNLIENEVFYSIDAYIYLNQFIAESCNKTIIAGFIFISTMIKPPLQIVLKCHSRRGTQWDICVLLLFLKNKTFY